jgi:hypothetical protein
MFPRVARVKTEETGWRLIALLQAACPFNKFALVMYAPDDGYEVVPTGPLHPIDDAAARQTVLAFHKTAGAR